jgi:N-acylneuraminate cytidylyltransferase
MKVVIPAQSKSSRIPRKNFVRFYEGLSLLEIKLQQLIDASISPDEIFVSSDDTIDAPSICKNFGVHLDFRPPELLGNEIQQPDLLRHLVRNFDERETILLALVTSPLFDEFAAMLDTWEKVRQERDSLVVVKPFHRHILDETGRGINFNFGYWHPVSQNLPSWFEITWAAFLFECSTARKYGYHFGVKPHLFETKKLCVDVDTPNDFQLAQAIYAASVKLSSEKISRRQPERNHSSLEQFY